MIHVLDFQMSTFLIPDKIKVSHIILDHVIATFDFMTHQQSSHTEILIFMKTQEHYLRMNVPFPMTEANRKVPIRSGAFKETTVQQCTVHF